MKRLFLLVILLSAGIAVFAQQAQGVQRPTSAQTRQEANQFIAQANTNAADFQAKLADLKQRNTSNNDFVTFNRIRSEIEGLETQIVLEESRISSRLESGARVNNELMNRIERLINRHSDLVAELRTFAQ